MPKRTAKQLTEPGIKKMAKAKPGQRREVYDKLSPGLALRVTDRGTKTWAVHYRYAGKHQRITLIEWPALGLEDARNEARNVRRWIKAGLDPKSALKVEAADRRAEIEAPDWNQSVPHYRLVPFRVGQFGNLVFDVGLCQITKSSARDDLGLNFGPPFSRLDLECRLGINASLDPTPNVSDFVAGILKAQTGPFTKRDPLVLAAIPVVNRPSLCAPVRHP